MVLKRTLASGFVSSFAIKSGRMFGSSKKEHCFFIRGGSFVLLLLSKVRRKGAGETALVYWCFYMNRHTNMVI